MTDVKKSPAEVLGELIEACNPGGLESAAEQCRAAGLSAVSSALLAMANAQRSALRQASRRGEA